MGMTTTNSGPFLAEPSQNTTFGGGLTPSASFDVIGTPGILLDSSLNQITGVQISQNGSDVTPAGTTTVNPLPDNTFPTTTYTFAGTSGPAQINFSANVLTGSNVVPVLNQNCCNSGTNAQSFNINDNQPLLMWSNPNGYPRALHVANDPHFIDDGPSGAETDAQIFFPVALNNATYGLALSSNLPGYNGMISFSEVGSCGSEIYSIPGKPAPLALVHPHHPYPVDQSTVLKPDAGCQLIATDTGGRTAVLTFYISRRILDRARRESSDESSTLDSRRVGCRGTPDHRLRRRRVRPESGHATRSAAGRGEPDLRGDGEPGTRPSAGPRRKDRSGRTGRTECQCAEREIRRPGRSERDRRLRRWHSPDLDWQVIGQSHSLGIAATTSGTQSVSLPLFNRATNAASLWSGQQCGAQQRHRDR